MAYVAYCCQLPKTAFPLQPLQLTGGSTVTVGGLKEPGRIHEGIWAPNAGARDDGPHAAPPSKVEA